MMCREKLEELKCLVDELRVIRMQEKEVLQKDKFLKSISYDVVLNNGMKLTREKLIKGCKDGSAAIIIPFISDSEVLMVIEPRVFTELTVGVGFPSGYIENEEDPTIGALRELREETGYVPKELKLIDSFYQDEGISGAFNHIFLAYGCEKKYKQELDNDEVVKYMIFNYDELNELEHLGYIRGGNTKLALAKSKQYIKKGI